MKTKNSWTGRTTLKRGKKKEDRERGGDNSRNWQKSRITMPRIFSHPGARFIRYIIKAKQAVQPLHQIIKDIVVKTVFPLHDDDLCI